MSEDLAYAVTLEAMGSGHSVTLRLGRNAPMPKEGGGGWEEVPLPRRGAVAVWKGAGLMKLSVPVHVDGTLTDRPVIPDILTLRHMHRPKDRTQEPPVLAISCPGDAIPVLDEIREWVLNDLEWGEAVGDEHGNRILQELTLMLLEYRPDERLESAEATPKPSKTRRYRIVRADLAGGLGGIAEHLHIRGGWQSLAAAQHPQRRDPRLTNVDVGRYLVIPVPSGVKGLLVGAQFPQTTSGG